jgi:antitoxin ParD1/3/4
VQILEGDAAAAGAPFDGESGSRWVGWQYLISIARLRHHLRMDRLRAGRSPILSSSLNVQLTDALREYVDERASDRDVYATPSEYIRDLIRQDMKDRAVALNILEGLADLRQGKLSDKSILDFKDEG